MKKFFSNKRTKIVVISVLVVFVLFAMVIPFVDSIIKSENKEIDKAVRELCKSPDIDERTVNRFVGQMENVLSANWKKEKFETKVVNEIGEINVGANGRNFEWTVYEITAQQILLEAAGYKSEAINNAYDKKISEILEQQAQRLEFDDFLEALIEEPYPTMAQEEKVLDVTLTYYTSPRAMLLSEFLIKHINKINSDAVASKNTNDIMSLCNKLSILGEYTEFEVSQLVNKDEIIKILTADAENIIIKEGEGGYYDSSENISSSTFKDGEFNNIAPGKHTISSVSTTKYYGDLAYIYFSRTGTYSFKDEEDETQYVSDELTSRKEVFLRGSRIAEGRSVDEKFIKYAYEDGMVNYHKDGNCFAVGDSSLVCYVGNITFNLYF